MANIDHTIGLFQMFATAVGVLFLIKPNIRFGCDLKTRLLLEKSKVDNYRQLIKTSSLKSSPVHQIHLNFNKTSSLKSTLGHIGWLHYCANTSPCLHQYMKTKPMKKRKQFDKTLNCVLYLKCRFIFFASFWKRINVTFFFLQKWDMPEFYKI